MNRSVRILSSPLVLLGVFCVTASCQVFALDLRKATVFLPENATTPEKKAAAILVDEVAKRTRLTLIVSSEWPGEGKPVIAIGVGTKPLGIPAIYVDALLPAAAGLEGYRVQTVQNSIVIVGNSPVAAVFGVGYLLRHLRMESDPMTGVAILDTMDDFRISTSPHHGIRGFQFNYRDWTNSYDGWTPAIFEQYVRDVAVFGANAIELMGPGPDNERESPHFPLSKIDMLAEMSRITADYGLQVWIFLPAWGSVPRGASPIVRNYADPKDLQVSLDEWEEVFRRMPRLDAVFVPGGDPGHTQPKYLMALLEKQTANLRRYHPDAEMWMSPQEFNQEWMDEFLTLLKAEPTWLKGIAYGPWTRLSLPELRERVPARYPIRLYPDIGHSTYGEYVVRDWDLALMVTHGREATNPRPMDMAKIFHYADKYNVGTLVYSEGINDDVNKFIFTVLDWDPTADVKQILREYSRYFLGPQLEEAAAEGILALERNWQGPLLTNGNVDQTFAQFRSLEQSASPQLLLNWRFQHLLYRAYFDYYVKTRLIFETSLQRQAMEVLREAGSMGSMVAMNEATRILTQAVVQPIGRDLRERLHELAAAMFQSIRSQLSVDRYKARSIDRGASLDSVDTPLNERYWLESRFAGIRQASDEPSRLAEIDKLINRANPGPGGFYDDLGDPTNQPHLEGVLPIEQDPGLFHSPHNAPVIFESTPLRSIDANRPDGPAHYLSFPMAWWTYEETRWETPLSLHYPGLDRSSRYKVRIVYYGWSNGDSRIRLVVNGGLEIHPYLKKSPQFSELEFDIPAQATANGDLRLQWQAEPGGRWPGVMVNEVFLIRK